VIEIMQDRVISAERLFEDRRLRQRETEEEQDEKEANRETDRQIERQTDSQTERQTQRECEGCTHHTTMYQFTMSLHSN